MRKFREMRERVYGLMEVTGSGNVMVFRIGNFIIDMALWFPRKSLPRTLGFKGE